MVGGSPGHKLSDFPKEENDLCWEGGLVRETGARHCRFLPVFDYREPPAVSRTLCHVE